MNLLNKGCPVVLIIVFRNYKYQEGATITNRNLLAVPYMVELTI